MIKIIKGVYGYMTANGSVKPKTSADAPFELTAEQEERLVNLGVAEYVSKAPAAEAELPDGVEGIPEYDASMKADELREIAKKVGLTFKVGTTKAEMVEALDGFFAEHLIDGYNETEETEDDGEEPPAFDPAQAVEE